MLITNGIAKMTTEIYIVEHWEMAKCYITYINFDALKKKNQMNSDVETLLLCSWSEKREWTIEILCFLSKYLWYPQGVFCCNFISPSTMLFLYWVYSISTFESIASFFFCVSIIYPWDTRRLSFSLECKRVSFYLNQCTFYSKFLECIAASRNDGKKIVYCIASSEHTLESRKNGFNKINSVN